ncbi:major capsid protein [Streptomyces puniciscabiei]|uniref:major capsid protein n=1 Tax=Streptomyces puniciscabiei TaxID=164348 RepID=UPI0033347129
MERHVEAINSRLELAAGDVLTDGKFSLSGENGLTLDVDFGVPAANMPIAEGVVRPDVGPDRGRAGLYLLPRRHQRPHARAGVHVAARLLLPGGQQRLPGRLLRQREPVDHADRIAHAARRGGNRRSYRSPPRARAMRSAVSSSAISRLSSSTFPLPLGAHSGRRRGSVAAVSD